MSRHNPNAERDDTPDNGIGKDPAEVDRDAPSKDAVTDALGFNVDDHADDQSKPDEDGAADHGTDDDDHDDCEDCEDANRPSCDELWQIIEEQKQQIEEQSQQINEQKRQIDDLGEIVDEQNQQINDLEETVKNLKEKTETAEQERDDIRAQQTEAETKSGRISGMIAKIVNTIRDYDVDKGEGVGSNDEEMPEEVANVADDLRDTVQACQENTELLKIREHDYDQQNERTTTKIRKQLSVLRYAQKLAKTEEKTICRMDYKDVAREYGCHLNDAYRVMRDMAEQVPGVILQDGRTLGPETQGVGGKHIKVHLEHPEIHAWMRARA